MCFLLIELVESSTMTEEIYFDAASDTKTQHEPANFSLLSSMFDDPNDESFKLNDLSYCSSDSKSNCEEKNLTLKS